MYIACDRVEDTRWCGKWECSFKTFDAAGLTHVLICVTLAQVRRHQSMVLTCNLGAIRAELGFWTRRSVLA